MSRRPTKGFWSFADRFTSNDAGATATEYATVLAVVLITVLAAVMLLGNAVGDTLESADAEIAQLSNGDDGGGGGEGGGRGGGS